MSERPKELNETVVRGLDADKSVVMVNLVRLRKEAREGGGTGWDSYVRYSQAVMPLLTARGGSILWAGEAKGAAFGDLGERRWDYVVLVRYPSPGAFRDMVTSPEYARANVHRVSGVEDHVILAAAEGYSKL